MHWSRIWPQKLEASSNNISKIVIFIWSTKIYLAQFFLIFKRGLEVKNGLWGTESGKRSNGKENKEKRKKNGENEEKREEEKKKWR